MNLLFFGIVSNSILVTVSPKKLSSTKEQEEKKNEIQEEKVQTNIRIECPNGSQKWNYLFITIENPDLSLVVCLETEYIWEFGGT